ncbi:hypothetical protein C5167_035598 [Papaver somniferum]|uniref:Uncharacterized protein n=1 Tax=Papaver somniferum TaxID=3469 RepID=A0A4Y7KKK2_PAPSO|nr:hypothetical protein C5167_035598 [Papaver somniferum]
MLERIYDNSPFIDLDDESQSWENEFKFLIDEKIDLAYFSDASMSSPLFVSPNSVLGDNVVMDTDDFFDSIYGPDSVSTDSNEEEVELDGLIDIHVGLDSDSPEYPSNLGKRNFSELSQNTQTFSPLTDYAEFSDWDFKIRDDGHLRDIVKKSVYAVGESSSALPAFIDLSSPNRSDEQFFTPENELSRIVKPAFIITFSSSSSDFSASPSSISPLESCGHSSSPDIPPPSPPDYNLELPLNQKVFNQYGTFFEESEKVNLDSTPIEEKIVSMANVAEEGNQGSQVKLYKLKLDPSELPLQKKQRL